MSRADETRARILNAALDEFSRHGVAGARVDRIAGAAACNKNLLYVYFGSKEELFAAVLDQHLLRLHDEIPLTSDDLPEFAGRLFDQAVARPDLMRLVAWSTLEGARREVPGVSRAHKVGEVARAQSDGLVGTAFTAEFLVSAIMALATAWSPAFPFGDRARPDDRLREQVVELVRRLVA